MRKRFRIGLLGAVAVVALCAPARAQSVPTPVDWSHKHLVITNAASPEERTAAARDPRSISNWLRRSQALRAKPQSTMKASRPARPNWQRDWSVSLGAGRVAPGMSPAKYGFYTSSTFLIVNCTTDYVA